MQALLQIAVGAIVIGVLSALVYWFKHDWSAFLGFAAATVIYQLAHYARTGEWFT